MAALEHGNLTNTELLMLAEEVGCHLPSKTRRKEIVSEIVHTSTARVDRPLDSLLAMRWDELLEYFERVRPSRIELMRILADLDFHPGSEAQKSLYKYAARQIAETGMFQRVAKRSGG